MHGPNEISYNIRFRRRKFALFRDSGPTFIWCVRYNSLPWDKWPHERRVVCVNTRLSISSLYLFTACYNKYVIGSEKRGNFALFPNFRSVSRGTIAAMNLNFGLNILPSSCYTRNKFQACLLLCWWGKRTRRSCS